MKPRLLAAAVALSLLAACGDDDAGVASAAYDRFRAQPTACGAEQPAPAQAMTFAQPDDLALSGGVTAILHTSCGDITVDLMLDEAPATVNSFVFLAEQGYFDGTVSHRIVPGFVVQLGDPTATGRGGPGYRILDELPESGFSYVTGVVAMANGGPNTGGSQFFITLADTALDADFTVFGVVTGGLDVLERIASIPVGTNPDGLEPSLPLQTLYLESVTIAR